MSTTRKSQSYKVQTLSDAVLKILSEYGCQICYNQDRDIYEARDIDNEVVEEFDGYDEIIEYAQQEPIEPLLENAGCTVVKGA